ncbi:transporter substrate-binding domain-containing protein [Pantoea sp. YR343]|uniref:transporter substrate-binding domain-containing protein n=1 Tax=Pantoea sp. YR343 TaxID=1144341 RepID=UPI000271150C|nr:transporter substrate-binding domain-containing protein [Pantoea sp. YR343]KAJ9431810.1 transporter substrate-binding domain-containing protein [Pantoea sp. YR343]
MKLAVATLFAVAALSAVPAVAQDSIRIATEGAYKPWSFINSSGKLDGFEIDFINALCPRIKASCQIVAQSWDGLIPSLKAGKFDAIVATMGVTPKRMDVINFSEAYAASPNTFMVLKDGPLANLAATGEPVNLVSDGAKADAVLAELSRQLKGKTVGVQISTTSAAFLHEKLKGVDVREYKTFDEAELDLLAGRVDAVITNITVIKDLLKREEMKNAKLAGPLLAGSPFSVVAVGLRKEDAALKSQLDIGIKSLRDDGTIKSLSEKWFGVDVTPRS